MAGPSLRPALRAVLLLAAMASVLPARVQAADLPAGFTERLVANVSSPTAIAIAPDGRVFVAEKGGRLRLIKNGQLVSTPVLTVSVNTSGERGLLGVAVDPDLSSSPFIYVHYTANGPVRGTVSRFRLNGDTASGEQVLFRAPTQGPQFHQGGAIHFGGDGKLYISLGDNRSPGNAQNDGTPLGKILRINKDGSIPADNPLSGRPNWAKGFRNPFTFAVQPGTGRIFVNDVGEGTFEEINDLRRGANYGWPDCEGRCNEPGRTNPIFQYGSRSGGSCAITGGTFYNPPNPQFPSQFIGSYFFMDLCAGNIRRLPAGSTSATGFATGLDRPADITVAPDGSMWYVENGGNRVFQITAAGNSCPRISVQPQDQTVGVGATANFSVQATGATPFTYQWRRNNANIPGTNSPNVTVGPVNMGEDGSMFSVVVRNNTAGCSPVTSRQAVLHVVDNDPPRCTITMPADRTLYSAGDTVNYAGTCSDPEDGALPASGFTWQVDLHHDTHTHPFVAPVSGSRSGSFAIPRNNEVSPNVWYRVHLTGRDSGGMTHSVSADVVPRVATMTFATNPAGLRLTLDGQPITGPHTVQGVVGIERGLGAPAQSSGGKNWVFDSWSDGGAQSHMIRTPTANTTFTARFREGTVACVNAAAGGGYQNSAIPNQTGSFTAEFDVTPSANPIDATVGLSSGAQSEHAGFGPIARFNSSGNIDARNGGSYAAAATIPYTAGAVHHFRLVVNVAARRYSAFVRVGAGAELQVANNFAFRSEQGGVTNLNNLGVRVNSTGGQAQACDVQIR